MKPKQITKTQLVSALRSMADSIEKDDSYEGSIEYEAKPNGQFDAQAFWRVGNLEGQGGGITIGEF